MNAHLIILVLAFVGIIETFYLCMQSLKKRPPVCVIGNSCEAVWGSPYSKTMGIGNDYLGLAFYVSAAVVEIAFLGGYTASFLIVIERVILGVGAAMSVYFVYIQWRVIKAWCAWCVFSAFLTWLMFATILLLA